MFSPPCGRGQGVGASDAQNFEAEISFVSVAASPPSAVSQLVRSDSNSMSEANSFLQGPAGGYFSFLLCFPIFFYLKNFSLSPY